MDFKKCTIQDRDALRDMSEKTYRDTFGRHNTKSDMDEYISRSFSYERIENELRNESSAFFFAVEQDNFIGYIKLNHAPAQTELNDNDAIEIERIYLLNAYQGGGKGQALMDFAVNYAKAAQKRFIWLGVWEKNEKALRFYAKNGFFRFGEHPYQLGDDVQLDYLLRKDI